MSTSELDNGAGVSIPIITPVIATTIMTPPAPVMMTQDATQTSGIFEANQSIGDQIVHKVEVALDAAGEVLNRQIDRANHVITDVSAVVDHRADQVRDSMDHTITVARVKASALADTVSHTASSAKETIVHTASSAKESIVHAAGSAKETIVHGASVAKENIGEAAEVAKQAAIRAKDQVVTAARAVGEKISHTVQDTFGSKTDVVEIDSDSMPQFTIAEEIEADLIDRGPVAKRARVETDRWEGEGGSSTPVPLHSSSTSPLGPAIVSVPATETGSAQYTKRLDIAMPKVLDGPNRLGADVLAQGP